MWILQLMQYTKYGRTPNQFTRGVHEHGLLRFQCYVNSASSPQFHLPMPTCHQFEHTHVQLAANMPEWAYKQGFIHQVVNTYQVCRCTYRWTSFECIQFCFLGCNIHQHPPAAACYFPSLLAAIQPDSRICNILIRENPIQIENR